MRNAVAGALVVAIASILAVGVAEADDDWVAWHVKAVHPKGYLMEVKAVGAEGELYDVVAIEEDGNVHLLDIKALDEGKRFPVKIGVSSERYAPVQAIGIGGQTLDIRALTPEGKQLDIRGMRRTGKIVHIKALGLNGRLYGVKAVSPDGRMYDIKGVKMSSARAEGMIGGFQIHAHVKALPPAGSP